MDNPLADYLRKFNEHVRPWFFANKTVPADCMLFLTKKGSPIKNIGDTFKKIMLKYFAHPVTVGTIRKVMETALSESTLSESEKNNLSNAMLHDPATAQEYYVSKDYIVASNAINQQWKQFRSAFVAQPTITTVSSLPEPSECIPSTPTAQVATIQSNNALALESTFTSVPSLASSPCQSAESSVEEENVRDVANRIADVLVPVRKSKPKPATFKYPMKQGDWNCSFCGYTNFARRLECNRCGKQKNKRSAYEISDEANKSKKHKTTEDITRVVAKAKNKDGEDIYKVVLGLGKTERSGGK